MASPPVKQLIAFAANLPARVLVPAAGLSLALMLTAMRWALLGSGLEDVPALSAAARVVRGSFQDWALVLVLVAAALAIARIARGPRLRRVLTVTYLGLLLILLLWGAANVVAVPLLGEPVTLDWVRYSDLANSRYALEAVMYFVSPGAVAAVLGLVLAFAILSLLLAWRMRKWQVKGLPLPVRAAPYLVLLLALVSAGAEVAPGKRSNAAFAFALSVVSDTGLPSDILQGGAVAAPLRRLLPVATPGERPETAPGQIKNVLFFVLESTPVKYSQGFAETYPVMPNLLNYVEQGRRFTNIYAHAPASNYSLVSLLAGIVPELSPHSMTYSYPDLEYSGIAGVLGENGFRTGFFSSSDNRFQNTAGFVAQAGFETIEDHNDWSCDIGVYDTEYDYLDTANDRCSVAPFAAWLDRKPDAPFFATIWTGMTHYPYFPGENPRDYVEDEDLNRYLNAVRVGDEALGEALAALTERGLMDETLVVVVGDHGEAFGEHDNYVHASALYEENIHVPLVLINPVLFSGGSSDVNGGLSDVSPTVLDLLGIGAPEVWQGQSLFAADRPDGVLFFAPWNGFQIGFRSGDRKYIFNANSGESWLFDLATDPDERVNLIDTAPDDAEAARRILAAWVQAQKTATDRLLRGAGEEPVKVSATAGSGELIVRASGTSYLTAPRIQVLLDGEEIGFVDVTGAPSNAERAVTEEEIASGVATYTLPVKVPDCARRLEFLFLNDEWEGEGQTGDTNLYVHSVELDGTRYYPKRFAMQTDEAGGQWGDYYVLWKAGTFWLDLYVAPECVTEGLTAN